LGGCRGPIGFERLLGAVVPVGCGASMPLPRKAKRPSKWPRVRPFLCNDHLLGGMHDATTFDSVRRAPHVPYPSLPVNINTGGMLHSPSPFADCHQRTVHYSGQVI
jgi:hypothetical protein